MYGHGSGDGDGSGADAGGRYFVTVYAPGREALLALSQEFVRAGAPNAS